MIYGIFDLDDTLCLHRGNLDYEMIRPDSTLSHYLKGFPGERYILTNATYDHAIEVLERMDIIRLFKKIYARDNTNLLKPSLELAHKVDQDIGITKDDTIYFFDDLPTNLWMGYANGWTTIWIHPHHEKKYIYKWIHHGYVSVSESLKDINMAVAL